MNTRNPDDIRKDLLIAQLKGSNVQLQIDGNHASAQALILDAEKLRGYLPHHVAAQKAFADELRAALEERGEPTTVGGMVIPMTAPATAASA